MEHSPRGVKADSAVSGAGPAAFLIARRAAIETAMAQRLDPRHLPASARRGARLPLFASAALMAP
jgi:hypothetical protein